MKFYEIREHNRLAHKVDNFFSTKNDENTTLHLLAKVNMCTDIFVLCFLLREGSASLMVY